MKLRKSTIIVLVILTTAIFPTSESFAQGWGEILLGVGSALLENHIDNSNRYSSQDKESMKNTINDINKSINVNQNARNATKDINQGNYTGAVIQGTQTIMNATGNHDYDTYLNSANQINKANREYKQDVQNGMDKKEALDKRNTTIGYSSAESIIELQDRIAQERLEKARQQREAERQSWQDESEYSAPSYHETGLSETGSQIIREYKTDNYETINNSGNYVGHRSTNNNTQILSSSNSVQFLTEEGESIWLHILYHGFKEGSYLSYSNHSDKMRRLSCDRAHVKVKYTGTADEFTFTDGCSFVMPANSDGGLEWSDIFPNLSDRLYDAFAIESIRVCFVDTQIDKVENNSNSNNDNNKNNNEPQLLTKNHLVKFLTDENTPVALGIEQGSENSEGCRLFFNNLYNDRNIKFSCSKVSIKVKYVGDDGEQTFSDACSFVMPANTFDYLEWSDVFFNISETREIESIKVQFIDTQIK